jgi:hypothetical protein
MCVSKGAPRKPSYGPCNEIHRWSQPIYTYAAWPYSNSTAATGTSFRWTAYASSTNAYASRV